MIIGINGYALSGKDTVGKLIQHIALQKTPWKNPSMSLSESLENDLILNNHTGWKNRKFADKLKEMGALLLGCNRKDFEDQDFKLKYLSKWGMTVREFMQKLGTNAVRNGLHKDAWVIAAMTDYTHNQNWVFTDTRFPNEAKAIKGKGGMVIRVNRDGIGPTNNHESEISLDDWSFDYIIDNNSDLESLIPKIINIIPELK